MTQRFTGWHMAAILTGFFAVVIAVNFTMARLAVATFGGTVVDNSYVASQHYARWLSDAEAQDRAGWRAETDMVAGRVTLTLHRAGRPVAGARVRASARHPLGALPDRVIELAPAATPGRYRATAPLPAGRWQVLIEASDGAARARFETELRA